MLGHTSERVEHLKAEVDFALVCRGDSYFPFIYFSLVAECSSKLCSSWYRTEINKREFKREFFLCYVVFFHNTKIAFYKKKGKLVFEYLSTF